MIAADLNPALTPVAFLLGTWRGEGEGQYPTIKPFRYREEIRFTHNGKTFLIYTQRTEAIDTGQPLHGEAGYLRLVGDGRVEFVIAQPIGFAEISLGRVDGQRIDVTCASVGRKVVSAGRTKNHITATTMPANVSMAIRVLPVMPLAPAGQNPKPHREPARFRMRM